MTSFAIIVINYESGTDLANCLAALEDLYENIREEPEHTLTNVHVVDNGSADGSLSAGKQAVDGLLTRYYDNDENRGFAAACNQAVERCEADYCLFLNPDAIANADALKKSLDHAERHDQVGVVSLQLRSGAGDIQRTCAREITPTRLIAQATGLAKFLPALGYRMEDWDHTETRAVDHVMGAYYLIETDLFNSLGGFDERFFVFYEDVDLSKRVREAGYEIHYLASTSIIHETEQQPISMARLQLSVESRIRYTKKHFGTLATAVTFVILLFVEPILRLLSSVLGRDLSRCKGLFRCYASIYASLRRNVL